MSHVLHTRRSSYSTLTGKTLTLEVGESQTLALGTAACWGAQSRAPISGCEAVLCPGGSRWPRQWAHNIPQGVLHQQKEQLALGSGRVCLQQTGTTRVCWAGLSPLPSHRFTQRLSLPFTHPRCEAITHPARSAVLPLGTGLAGDTVPLGKLPLAGRADGEAACALYTRSQPPADGCWAAPPAPAPAEPWDVPAPLSPVFQARSRAVSHGRPMDTGTLLQHM